MFSGVAPDDFDLLPRHRQDVGSGACQVEHGMRPEIADTRLHVELAVGTDGHDGVKDDRAGSVGADRDADAANLRTTTLPAARLARFPAEHLDTAIERFLHERARHV